MSKALTVRIRDWMFEDALPFWAERGIDRVNGGYVEQLRLDGTSADVPFKRTRVTCRQVYVFSHAALLGWKGGAELAHHGCDFLLKHGWLGPDKGWARRMGREGGVVDETPDLYDLAFVLFALGWFYRATGETDALHWAFRTLDFLDARMRHPGGKGFLCEKPANGPRQQNPHMHLLEAALVCLEATGHLRFRGLADELVDLFSAHFYDRRARTLAEYFNEDWSRASGDMGRVTEPGHQFEWAWILAGYQRATGRDMREPMRGLVAFAEMHGVDAETGATYNRVRDDGLALDRGSRVWPNAERLQAAVALFETVGRDPRGVFATSAAVLLDRHLAHSPRGSWIEEFDGMGVPRVDGVPASTLYHLFIAFAEILRTEEAIARAFPD